MEYRRIGRSGLKVSEICLGTMSFGTQIGLDEARPIVDLAYDAGINFIDTADGYGRGASEEILGELLKSRRREVVLASKFFNPMGPGPNDSGMSRVHVMNAVEDSLRRLQTDHLDIYYIHHTDEETPLEEMLRAVDDLVHQGKVRYVACSNYAAWRLCDALWISEANGLARFECYQPQYSLVVRDIEQELVPLCLDKGLGIVAWGPMGSGFLTGKYRPGERLVPGSRSESGWAWHERFFAANADETLAALLEVAEKLGRTPAQVALRWVLEQPAVASVIAGVRTVAHLRDNAGASGWRLEGEPLARLNAVSALPDRYPQSFERTMRERRASALDMPSLRE
jgi:aryl-alcohol dehydrogenase-like predicted oxidoreductase